ncbi:MAG: alpha/beta fold hydrolase [Pseudomonadales bacterium]|nr:alpha/beta fold hydrolase [Pseudomonadales bacterium]
MQKSDTDLTALIALVYENALTPSLSQGLTVPGDSALAEITGKANDGSQKMLEPDFVENIVPHLNHAAELETKQRKIENVLSAPVELSLFDLPVPVCVFSNRLELTQVNNLAQAMLKPGASLPCKAESVLELAPKLRREILSAVLVTMDTKTSQTLSAKTEDGILRTALVIPQNLASDAASQHAVVLFLNHESRTHELAMALTITHGLTQSEAEVVAYLAQGFPPEEIATKKQISIHTVRTQIKRVFAKTGTSRQAQLVSLALNGPALWMSVLGNGKQNAEGDIDADFIPLEDGRILSYGDYGPSTGTPVVLFHHLFGSRQDKPDDETLLSRLGIRLIVPERPGRGLTSDTNTLSLLAWADDIRQLMEQLELDRFHVLGLSAGAPFAAACAAVLPQKVISVGILASQMPVDELPGAVKMSMVQRAITSLARRVPSVAHRLLESRYAKLLENPAETLARFKQGTNPADQLLHKDPKIYQVRLQNIHAASTRPSRIYAQELVTLFRPWGFRLSELKMPVLIWHGKQDDLYPFDHASAMANIIPNCKTLFEDDWGHFFPLKEWESILGTLIRHH